ncbi:hypothetical protein Y1Q_0008896 [Alligator mississippiensis]|uniref:Nascent polypeptide-associated complex subunit alpha, muscle-specific form-like n=2 Tax=Alligator mississippiensis TaxID=8496 RepID=A0A151P1I0_ALLMI|nr:hypothetical protein Y1Q_0008896 [Alligator mississippiensis]
MAIEGGNFTTAYFKQQTIRDLFDMPLDEPVRKDGDMPAPTPEDEDDPVATKQTQILEQALCKAEDPEDIRAATQAKAEQVAELAEFNENIPLDADDRPPRDDDEEMSKAEQEIAALVEQLTPIERYAMNFLEASLEDVSREELKQAEEQVEAARKDIDQAKEEVVFKLPADEEAGCLGDEVAHAKKSKKAKTPARAGLERTGTRASERLRGSRLSLREAEDAAEAPPPRGPVLRPARGTRQEPEEAGEDDLPLVAQHTRSAAVRRDETRRATARAPGVADRTPQPRAAAAAAVTTTHRTEAPRPDLGSGDRAVRAMPADRAPRPAPPKPDPLGGGDRVLRLHPQRTDSTGDRGPKRLEPEKEGVRPVSPQLPVPETPLPREDVAPSCQAPEAAPEQAVMERCPASETPPDEAQGEPQEPEPPAPSVVASPCLLGEPEVQPAPSPPEAPTGPEHNGPPPLPPPDAAMEPQVPVEEPPGDPAPDTAATASSSGSPSPAKTPPRRRTSADVEIGQNHRGQDGPAAKVLRKLPGRLVTVVEEKELVRRRRRCHRSTPMAPSQPELPTGAVLSPSGSSAHSISEPELSPATKDPPQLRDLPARRRIELETRGGTHPTKPEEPTPPPPKRKRGRPPKNRSPEQAGKPSPPTQDPEPALRGKGSRAVSPRTKAESSEAESPLEKRRRGRPPKTPAGPPESPPKRKRGRPPKNPASPRPAPASDRDTSAEKESAAPKRRRKSPGVAAADTGSSSSSEDGEGAVGVAAPTRAQARAASSGDSSASEAPARSTRRRPGSLVPPLELDHPRRRPPPRPSEDDDGDSESSEPSGDERPRAKCRPRRRRPPPRRPPRADRVLRSARPVPAPGTRGRKPKT